MSGIEENERIDYTGLREWLEHVDAIGQLRTVRGANWEEEIGQLAELNIGRTDPPALLFDEVPGYPPGFRVLASSVNTPERLGITFRSRIRSLSGLIDLFAGNLGRWEREAERYRPVVVDDGPVLEVTRTGSDIDLAMFPVPTWHAEDGGRYIGTGCAVITRDASSGWVNLGAYRSMITGPRELSLFMATASRHGRQHILAYHERGEPAPVVMTVGQDPLISPVLAGLTFGEGVGELDVAGAVAGSAVEVVEGPVTGLPIPATAEIAIEGWIHPGRTCVEGPHGEGLGYYAGEAREVPAITVEAIHHRGDPILLGAPPGRPPHDYSLPLAVAYSAKTQLGMEAAGIPGVQRVWMSHLTGRPLQVVSIRQQYFGHSRQAGLLASQVQAGVYMGRMTIVVDDDIDVTDLAEVMWATVTRADPATDYVILDKMFGSPIDPLNVVYDEGTMYSSRVVIDACRPFQHLDRFARLVKSDPADLRRVEQKFADQIHDAGAQASGP